MSKKMKFDDELEKFTNQMVEKITSKFRKI